MDCLADAVQGSYSMCSAGAQSPAAKASESHKPSARDGVPILSSAQSCRARCPQDGAAHRGQRTQHHCLPLACCREQLGQWQTLGTAIAKRSECCPVLRKYQHVRRGADMVSARCRLVLERPPPTARPCAVVPVACVAGERCGHPLRFYITPHFVK
jgi:hypothetical protein